MTYDLLIIGGGPAGLGAAVYAGRSVLNTLIIEKKSFGGRLKDTSEIVNYPGVMRNSGIGLVSSFREHAQSYDTNKFIYGTVTTIEKKDGIFIVGTKRKGFYKAKSVILCLGTESKMIGVEGENDFVGRGLSYCATCDAEFIKGLDVHVVGSGDVALEEADYLSKFANKVTIIVVHDKGIVDGNEIEKRKAFENPKIDFIWNTTLSKIKGDEYIKEIVLKNLKTKEEKTIPTEGLFIFVGAVPKSELVKELVELDEEGYIIVDEKKETNIGGLFAAGDITKKYLRQVITAVSDGSVAAVAAEKYIRNYQNLHEEI